MPSKGQWVYWDTSVFLDYFNKDDQHHAVIDEVLRDIRASNGQRLIATSTFTLAEAVHIKAEIQPTLSMCKTRKNPLPSAEFPVG